MNTDLLKQVALLNAERGTPNRYRIISLYHRAPHTVRKVALVKAVGKFDTNVSGWLTPKELSTFLSGWTEGWRTHEREVTRSMPWR